MPRFSTPLILIALRMGAPPFPLLTKRRALDYLFEHPSRVPPHLLGDALHAISCQPDALLHEVDQSRPDAFAAFCERAVVASEMPRPRAVARLLVSFPVGPEDASAGKGLMLPWRLRSRVQADLALAGDLLCISERGGPYVAVDQRTMEEVNMLFARAREMDPEETAAVHAALGYTPVDYDGMDNLFDPPTSA